MKKLLPLVLSLVLALSMMAAPAALAADEYVIGCPQPLTGTNAQPGECALNAVKLAVKQINEAGGILGKQIRLVSYDDQGSPEEAVKVATKLVQVDKVQGVIGSCISSCVLSSSAIFNDAKVPVFGHRHQPDMDEAGLGVRVPRLPEQRLCAAAGGEKAPGPGRDQDRDLRRTG